MNSYTQLDFTKLKPAGYNRKSSESEDKQMLSISSQLDEAKRISDYYKLPKFVEVFEEAKSAKKEFARPEFMRMLEMIRKGTADSIVCWKLDRLARNMTEGGILIDLLSSGVLKAIITHDKVYYPSDNVLLMAVEFGQGKQFVKDLSVNVKRGQKKKASLGLPHGIATLGFLNDKTEEKGNRKWLVDKPRLDAIKILLDMFLTGTYSAGKIHKYAVDVLKLTTVKRKRSGGEPIASSRIYEILTDPVYAAFFVHSGERYELDPKLPKLITEAQHIKIRNILSRNNIPKIQSHQATYSGFFNTDEGNFMGQDVKHQLICDCKHKFAYKNRTHCPQCGIEISKMSNPKYLEYVWYYDVRSKKKLLPYKHISEKVVDQVVQDDLVQQISFSPEMVEWSKKHIHEMKDKEVSEKLLISQRKDERQEEFKDKKAKTRAMLRDGKITDAEYKDDMERLASEYMDTKDNAGQIDWYSRMESIIDITAHMQKVFAGDDIQAKREILSSLGSNLVLKDGKPIVINAKEIDALINGIKRVTSIYPEFEPSNYVANKGLNGEMAYFMLAFSTMLRG